MKEPKAKLPDFRDIFLSHRSTNENITMKLAADIEKVVFKDRNLLTWVYEAEIPPGQSIPGMINQGLEMSRFFGIIMTPDYFESDSGWTDAEWHSALQEDPDNRNGRIIPLLLQNCPHIPPLLRHLNMIDLRKSNYSKGFKQLIDILCDKPLPRPTPWRGQIITSSGMIDRQTLVAERAIPQSDPDIVTERLYCNLLPILKIPEFIYMAPVSNQFYKKSKTRVKMHLSKMAIKEAILESQMKSGIDNPYIPAFRTYRGGIVTLNDLEDPESPFSGVNEGEFETIASKEWNKEKDKRNIFISLMNMALFNHAVRAGLESDNQKWMRFFFPPSNEGLANEITWIPRKKKTKRTVAKPCLDKEGKLLFWRHQAAYLSIIYLANEFYLQIIPTWIFTLDGFTIMRGPKVNKLAIQWCGAERNMGVLYHVRFWTTILRGKTGGPIVMRAGDQNVEIDSHCAFIQIPYGIEGDQKDLERLLDKTAAFLDKEENELANIVAEDSSLEDDKDEIEEEKI
jgi:hypothetical protein